MKTFFKVTDSEQVLELRQKFKVTDTEEISLLEASGRILGENITSDYELPDFSRSTMDGYAVAAASVFGASEGNPAYLNLKGNIMMGEQPSFSISPGEAAKIPTGGMIPQGADSVVMVEYTQELDEDMIEVYKSTAPGNHVIQAGEDFKKGVTVLSKGRIIKHAESGILAAFGRQKVRVFKKPVIGIISTGDEIVPIDQTPKTGQIRDINSYTLASQVLKAGCIPVRFGIIKDDYDALFKTCEQALKSCDMIMISGGSSVGTRDFTIDVLSSLPESKILVHGISISPGKPTILAEACGKPFWGLPGHVVSAMVVFETVVRPFAEHICGVSGEYGKKRLLTARLNRNVPSAHGRTDFIRVRLIEKNSDAVFAEPVLGKSGLINTMIKADGIIKIDRDTEGLDKGSEVGVMLFD